MRSVTRATRKSVEELTYIMRAFHSSLLLLLRTGYRCGRKGFGKDLIRIGLFDIGFEFEKFLLVFSSVHMRFPKGFAGQLLIAQSTEQLSGIGVSEGKQTRDSCRSMLEFHSSTLLMVSRCVSVSPVSSVDGEPPWHRPVSLPSKNNP